MITDCKCFGRLPESKCYSEVQFSTIKRRSGRASIPFLDLDPGIHRVRFFTAKKSILRDVEVWLSLYGWAWQIKREKNGTN